MTLLFMGLLVLMAAVVILCALCWKGDVKAAVRFWSIAFLLDAKERKTEAKGQIGSGRTGQE